MFRTTYIRDQSGFTLVEMLVVMALLALAATAGSFLVLDSGDRIKVGRAADRVEQVLLLLGDQAARSGEDRAAAFTGHLLSSSSGIVELPADVTLRWTTAIEAAGGSESPAIVFFGTGGASGGTLEMTKGRASAVIEVGWLDAKIHRAR